MCSLFFFSFFLIPRGLGLGSDSLFATVFVSRAGTFVLRVGNQGYPIDQSNPVIVIGGKIRSCKISPSLCDIM
jgi:hypothetical protein